MLKFMKHQQKLTPERIQKQKELFSFTKVKYFFQFKFGCCKIL